MSHSSMLKTRRRNQERMKQLALAAKRAKKLGKTKKGGAGAPKKKAA